jgi:hypothetical protein
MVLSRGQPLFKTLGDPFHTKIAFHHGALLKGVELFSQEFEGGLPLSWKILGLFLLLVVVCPLLIGTTDEAGPTAHAFIVIDEHNAVIPLISRAGGAGFDTCRIFTVIAEYGINEFPGGRKFPGFTD